MQNGRYEVSSGDKKYVIEVKDSSIMVDGDKVDIDISKISPITYTIISNGQSRDVEVIDKNPNGKSFNLRIAGKSYPVTIANELDLRLNQLGMNQAESKKNHDITAPMPGLLLSFEVEVGDSVEEGDKLLVLEAMKMENVIKAQGKGIVKNLHGEVGQSVEFGQLLVAFEEE